MADCENEMRRSENSDWEVGGVAGIVPNLFARILSVGDMIRIELI